MTIYDLTKARQAIQAKQDEYTAGLAAAHERAVAYFKERVEPAENDYSIELDEMNAIYDTYDDLCDTCSKLEELLDIATDTIKALAAAEEMLAIAESEGVWNEG